MLFRILLMGTLLKYLFLPLFIIISTSIFGQKNDMLKHFLTVENGLSLNEVTSIVQDQDGFMWIGTRGGLNRYDGYEFKIFNQVPEDSNSLVNPSVETLFIDSKENIWIGTKSGGVSKYNPVTGKFKNIVNNYQQTNAVISSNRVLSFYEDKQGKIWMGTWGEGLFVYNEAENSAKQYLNGSRINTIIGTGDDRIWAGASVQNGLYEYIAETDSFVQRMENPCQELVYDEPRNVLWAVGGDNIGAALDTSGLTRFDLRNNKWSNYNIKDSKINSSKLPHSFYSLHLDDAEKIWIGTWGTGLYIFDPELESFERSFIYPPGDQNTNKDYDAVLDIFQDKSNNIWLGTNGGGICVLTPRLGFNSVGYNPEPNKGLTNSRLRSILEDSAGNIWIGTVGSGLLWSTDMLSFYLVDFPPLIDKSQFFVMKYMLEDVSGNIWAGTNLGTYIIEFKNGFPQMVKASKKFNS
jgi:ligand-binding sensor domain-containing protein